MVLVETTTGEDTIYYLHGLDLVAQSDGTSTEYFTYDALGSVRQLADDAANPLLTQTYDPYGTVYASVGAETSNYGFTGEQVDANGLVYLRARYYQPGMGRFLNTDPSRQERNIYAYVDGNPIIRTDPDGQCWFLEGAARAACLEGLVNGIFGSVDNLAWAADTLKAIDDPTRNPRTSAFHRSLWEGANAWRNTIVPGIGATAEYTYYAMRNGCEDDVQRGLSALDFEARYLGSSVEYATALAFWGYVTTPYRFVAHDIPEFYRAVNERSQGMGRGWDVVFTGTNVAGDAAVVYGQVQLVSSAFSWLETQIGGQTSTPKIDPQRADHIFRQADNHLPTDTPANRALLEGVAADSNNYLGPDIHGNEWYAALQPDGSQVWAQIRGGMIVNGGVNTIPKSYNPQTGLCDPPNTP